VSVITRLVLLGGSLVAFFSAANPASVRAQQKAPAPVVRTDAAVAKVLAAKTDLDLLNVPLEDFVKGLTKDRGIAIRIDASGLRRAKVAASVPVTASFKQVPLGVALRQILRPLKLQHRVADGTIIIDDIGLALDEARPLGARVVGRRAAPMLGGQFVRAARGNQVVMQFNNGQGLLQPLRLVLQVELGLVKAVCAPTPEQMQHLKQEGLKQIADTARDAQQGRDPQLQNQARRAVQEKLAELVHAQLSPAQAARYDGEIKKRNANLRQVCAQNLVVALDEQLALTEWQRQKLTAELSDNWDDAWTTTVVVTATQMPDMLPNVPDELVVPYLDATQRGLWNSLPKRGMIYWGIQNSAFLGMDAPQMDDRE
jgi:hypothetical protein